MPDSRDKSTAFSANRSLQCGDKIISLDIPKVMGILNLTPDSFYDGGRYQGQDKYLDRVEEMLLEGADIIDVGCISTRPGAREVSEKEELHRLLDALMKLVRQFPDTIFSVDTFRAKVARLAVENGAGIINDISGGNMDEGMFSAISELGVPYILMHMQGTPATMQINPSYNNLLNEVDLYFSNKIEHLKQLGVNQIILDPGFGFGKSLGHNYSLLNDLPHFKRFGLPLLVGVSRKSMINKLLGIQAEEALHATGVLNTLALLGGADILRVHDVKEAVQVIKIVKAFRNKGE
ncbi:MAG: dihydropteroate synthase [Bacteroidetes bacterium]|nr:dihydropteroate synthase [Bacteroidota bacterium]